jgi:hypothetical protein
MAAARHRHPVLVGLAAIVSLVLGMPPAVHVTGTTVAMPAPTASYAVALSDAATTLTSPGTIDPAAGSVTVRVFRSQNGTESVTAALAGQSAAVSAHYAFLTRWGRLPARWDPCTTIRWKVNYLGNRVTGELTRLKAAFAETSRATGITFVYAGRTSVAVGRADTGADVVVWFATLRQGASMYGSHASRTLLGVGGHTDWQLGENAGAPLVPQRGEVALVASAISRLTARERTNLYLHELGHVMNLGHVIDATQVMNPSTSVRSPGRYGTGDRNGLAAVGRTRGCVATPARPAAPTFRVSGDDVVISVPPVTSVAGAVTYVLRDAALRTVIRTSSVPRFTVPLSELMSRTLLRDAAFQVVAGNWVGQLSGAGRSFEIPGADLVALPSITATATRISVGDAALRICGTTIATTEGLTVSGSLIVAVYQGDTPSGMVFTLRGPGDSMALSGFRDVVYHLSGRLTFTVTGSGSRTVDYAGVVIVPSA